MSSCSLVCRESAFTAKCSHLIDRGTYLLNHRLLAAVSPVNSSKLSAFSVLVNAYSY